MKINKLRGSQAMEPSFSGDVCNEMGLAVVASQPGKG